MSEQPETTRPPLVSTACLVAGLLCLLALPLLFSHFTYYRAYLKVVALQAGATFIFFAALTSRRPLRETLLPGTLLPVAIWVWLGVQLASIALLKDKWLAAAPLAQQIPFCFSAVILMRALADRPRLSRVFAFAYLAVVAVVILLLLTVRDPADIEFIPFGNRNLAGTFLIVPIVVSVALLLGHATAADRGRSAADRGRSIKYKISFMIRTLVAAQGDSYREETGKRRRSLFYILSNGPGRIIVAVALLAAAGVALWQTRCLAATVGSGVGAWLLVVVMLPRLRKPVLWGTAGGVLAALLVIFVVPGMAARVGSGVYQSTAGIRLLMWGGSLRASASSWGLGTGVGSFFVSYTKAELPLYYSHVNAAVAVYQAHNWPLHTLVEQGVIGVAALAWLIIESLRSGWRAWRRSSGVEALVRLGLLGALAGIVVDALFSTSPHFAETQINFWLILACFGVCELRDREGKGDRYIFAPENSDATGSIEPAKMYLSPFSVVSPFSVAVRWVLGPVAVGLAAMAILGGSAWLPTPGGLMPERDLTRGIALKDAGERALAEQKPERAVELFTQADESLTRAHTFTYEPEVFISSALHLARVCAYFGRLAEAIVLHEQIEALVPNFGSANRNFAALYAAQGDWAHAAEQLLKYLNKNRFDDKAYAQLLALATQHQMLGAAARALPLLDYAIPRMTRDPAVQLRLRQLYQRFQGLAMGQAEETAPLDQKQQ